MVDVNIICAYLGLVVIQLIYASSSPVLKFLAKEAVPIPLCMYYTEILVLSLLHLP